MLRKLVVPAMLAGTIGAGVIAELPTTSAGAENASTGESDAVARAASSTSLTADAVSAAQAFKASLTASQRSAVQYAFSSSKKKTGWSNLPTTLVARNGVAIKDLTTAQKAKLRTLLKTILSTQGYADEEAIRKADTYLNQQQQSGSGGAQNLSYGEGLYYIALYGTPSRSHKWTVQFGGHHLAIHMTFSGAKVSNTPYFTGVEPGKPFKENGKTYAPLSDEASALFGAVQSLNTSQRKQAKLSQTFDDVLVGPGQDGNFPTPQGVTVSKLSASQRLIVTRAIRSYVGDMPSKQAKARVALYKRQYAKTKLAYSGSTNPKTVGSYVRLQGPRVWIEIAVQNGIVLSGYHYHSIERDQKSDYGAGT